jgi:hypothetical protein
MEELTRILIEHLVAKGMEITSIPSFIRSVATTIAYNPSFGVEELNSHLHLLGWDDFELDCHSFYLIAEVLDPDLASELSHSFDPVNDHEGLDGLAREEERSADHSARLQ